MDNNTDKRELYFSIQETVQDAQIDLSNLSLPLISEFTEAVIKFIRGSSSVDLSCVKVAIKEGSLAIAVQPSPIIASAVADYDELKSSGSLDKIDRARALIIADFQNKARKNPGRTYTISDTSEITGINSDSITINNVSEYRITIEDTWVLTETYMQGKVFDIGGKTKPNVHMTLENGDTIKLDAEAETLAGDTENRLYKDQLVRIKAEQNLRTKKLRKESLVSFEKYSPHFDESEFQALSAKVKSSWADVSDIVAWVEEARGNRA